MTQTILVTDCDFPDLSIEKREVEGEDIEIVEAQAETEAEVREAVADAKPDALMNQYAPVTREVLETHPGIQAVGRYGIGVDTIDLEAATEHNIIAINVPDYCLQEVSTHTISLILSLERNIPQYSTQVTSGTWEWTTGKPIHRLKGRTIGFAGFGKIPQHLVKKATIFGLEPIAYDPYIDSDVMTEYGVEKVTFEELLEQADIISAHTPLTDDTREMFNRDAFSEMKEEAILINTSRGEIIDINALHDAIVDGEIRGAGLDVFPDEPPNTDDSIFDLEEIVFTPHVAWYSEESIIELRSTIVNDICQVLNGNSPSNPVN